MDGFTGSEGVIVLAATNRPEVLDSALLRPGRFDRRVVVNPPDKDGRRKILEVHTRSVPLADDVDLDAIASTTPGMVGADLRNLVNEAALTAARREHDRVQLGDFTDALEQIVLGAERRITLSIEERERTAYHESGHAVLGMLEPGADPVRKVSIVPRGRALGVTFQSPESDRYGYDERYLRGRIVGALGGRAAEEIVYGNVTTGAESDLEQVTHIARQMVGRWGMSDRDRPGDRPPGPATSRSSSRGPAAARRRRRARSSTPRSAGSSRSATSAPSAAEREPRAPRRPRARAAGARDARRARRLPRCGLRPHAAGGGGVAMPHHDPSGRADPGELLAGKVVMRRRPDGKLEIVTPPRVLTETTEAAERPPTPDDPRRSAQRNIPPYGGGV